MRCPSPRNARRYRAELEHLGLGVIEPAHGIHLDALAVLECDSDRVVVTSSTGNEGRTSEATVNVSTGDVVSESPVEVKLTNGWLDANRLEVLKNGDLIRFGGGVEMTINPEPQLPPEAEYTATSPVLASV